MVPTQNRPNLSRRAMLRLGAIVASVSALWPSFALAESRDNDEDRDGHGRRFPFKKNSANLMLVPVNSVNGGTGGGDFSASNPGGDGLGRGAVVVSNTAGRQIGISLSGAPANVGYDVQFERLNDHGREDLGSITTNGNGNFSGLTPNVLGGTNRVGAIVLIRNGQDEYVTSWA